MFKVTIVETMEPEKEVKRYEQIVDVLDLAAVMAAVNRKPRTYTKRAKKGGAE